MVAKKIKIKNKKHNEFNIEKFITYFLASIICAGVFLKGYFFEKQSLSVNIITGAFFISIMVIYYNRKKVFYYNLKYLLLGLSFLLVNISGLIFASDIRDALGNVLLIFNSLLLFLLALQVYREKENIYFLLKSIYYTSVAVAAIALSSYIFGVNILNSYVDNRLFATLSYPNTAALMFIIAFFIGLLIQENSKDKLYLLYFSNSLLFLAFLATKSRGVLLLFPVLILIYIFMIGFNRGIQKIKTILLTLIPTILIFPLFYKESFDSRSVKGTIVSLLCLLFLIALFYIINKIKFNKKLIITTSMVVLFIFIGISVYYINTTASPTIANNDIVDRLKRINFQEQSVQERFIFMKDALKIVKDHPLLGVGGGGWNAEYRSYRTFLYFTTEVHNHYLQVMVESGIIGFVIYILLWLLLLIMLYKKIKLDNSLLNITVFIIVFSIFLHSFIDFDLTYPLFYFLFWIFIAISTNEANIKTINLNNKNLVISISTIVLILILINSSLLIGWAYGNENISNVDKNALPKLIDKFENSIRFDPINSENLTKLAQLYFAKSEIDSNEQYKLKALTTVNKAIKYNSTNFSWYLIKTRLLVGTGEYEKGFQVALKTISLAPLEEFIYYNTAKLFIEESGINSEALKYAKKIIATAKEETNQIDGKYLKWWHGKLPYSDRVKELEEKL